ncbi:MAG: hypothetical protein V4629_12365 [Pseudomonadota bacterium]
MIQQLDSQPSNRSFTVTGVTEQNGRMLKEKLIQIEKNLDSSELFGNQSQTGVDLNLLLNKMVGDVNQLLHQSADASLNILVIQENISQIDSLLNQTEGKSLADRRKIAELQQHKDAQQARIDNLEATVQQVLAQQAAAPTQTINTQCCEIM